MKTLRTALLVAAALAIVPAAAHAEDRFDRHGHGERGDRGGDGGDRVRGDARPAPPQAQTMQAPSPRTSVLMPPRAGNDAPSPRANWGGGQPGFQQPQQRTERGVWPGGGAGRGDRGGEWRQRPDARPTPPQAVTGGQPQAGVPGQPWDNRNQWGRDGRDRDHRAGDRHDGDSRWDNRNRGVWPGGDRRWDNDQRRDNDHRWDNDRRSDRDRYQGRDGRWGRDDRRDGTHVWTGNNHRWDPSRWRNDHRYDWRGWRNNHHDLFRWRYSAPRGYHYRPVYRGFYLEPFFYGSSYWLADPFEYRLPPVEWPLRWVRYYNDALLVDVTTGEVVDIIQEFFW